MIRLSYLKQVFVFAAILVFVTFAYLEIAILGSSEIRVSSYKLALVSLFQFILPFSALLAWLGWNSLTAIVFLGLAVLMSLLATAALDGFPLWVFAFFYVSIFLTILFYESLSRNRLRVYSVDIEKNAEAQNELRLRIEAESRLADAFLKRYTRYYGLREVCERFATTLSLDKLSSMIVETALDFVGRGELCLLYLADPQESKLSLISSKTTRDEEHVKLKEGDVFDRWVLKNGQRLLVQDVDNDFRFDTRMLDKDSPVKSLIIAPLVHEGRVVGTLRINSNEPDRFSTEELRILDLIAGLASSALGNTLLYAKTEELAIRDSLTGLFVQRYFRSRLKEEHRRSLLKQTPLSLLMLDLDFFKAYNDRYGHGAGDIVLFQAAGLMKEIVGELGIVSRYGGEEFAIILPNTDLDSAASVAEAIRRRVKGTSIEIRREPTKITISVGVANFPADTLDCEELIGRADQFLYQAKKAGRDRVCSSAL
ncbi:MAG: diguanylate cyclase [Candidatus Omnitrophica bacterium]|nr:diguanylate cyclase [Candidatus Omnitrophota bacterium]